MLTVLLTRHGHTDLSEPEQYLGQRLDPPLSARGRDQAISLRDRLARVAVDRIVTSPLARAVDTAEILAADRPGPPVVERDKRLAEMDYGRWEGLTRDEIEGRFPGEFDLYTEDPAAHKFGGGESGRQVARRLGGVLDGLLEWAESGGGGKTCVVVGHSSTNRILLALVLGVALRDYRRRFDQDWANLTVLNWPDRDSGPVLRLSNDLSHWRGTEGVTWG